MSDNFVDPILAEGFDPNGPEPNVVYSKANIINLSSLQQSEEPPHTHGFMGLIEPVTAHSKALKEGATEEEAVAAADAAQKAIQEAMEAQFNNESQNTAADDQDN